MKAISAFSVIIFIISLLFAQITQRTDTDLLMLSYSVCFAAFLILFFNDRKSSFKIYALIGTGILLRFILIFLEPNLSDDYLRFIWDGNLQLNGFNPFAYTPEFIYENRYQDWMEKIYPDLNSPGFFTVYPAVCQYTAFVAAAIFPGSLKAVFALKFIIWVSECLTIFTMFKLVKYLKLNTNNVLIYALNPLIILELSGNIHFDALAICFLMAAILLMLKKRYFLAGVILGLAIASKITPLILIPYLLFSLKPKKILIGGAGCLATIILLHLPYVSDISSIQNSLFLYYDYFEFNASIYGIIKWLFSYMNLYDLFLELKILLPIITIVLILILQFLTKRSDLRSIGLVICFSWLIFFLFSTTIHPWYISMVVAAAVICNLKFPLIWSLLIFFTYMAYKFDPPYLPMAVIFTEYILLMIVIFIDIKRLKEPNVYLNS
ncbi:MAG: DUF2029 domain-containing protein [Chitinophagales bacterium]|nr:DUF2029 domain-containing protein [Chitinophagales bacterium]